MSREAFEHWYADYTGDAHVRKYCDSTGRYQFNAMQSAWNAWQAALQHSGEPSEWVIEVENGQVVMSRIGANFTGYLYATPQPVIRITHDEACLALWQAIRDIKAGNKTDDKLIFENLRKAGVWLCRASAGKETDRG